MIKVTVITIVFNDKSQISKTIDSVISQDFPSIEYIVIDGASTDGTVDIIKNYLNKIDIFISEIDDGIYDAMNKGIRLATGDFIVFMNSGDIFASYNAISTALQGVSLNEDRIIFGNWIRHSKSNNSFLLCRPEINKMIFNHQATVYSRRIHLWHGEYLSINGFTAADYLFFASLLKVPTVSYSTVDVTIAKIDDSGISAGLQTVSQKFTIDYLCGRVTKIHLILILIVHPAYRKMKTFLEYLR